MGVTDLTTSLRSAADDLVDVELGAVAREAAGVMASLVPVRSGRARASIRTVEGSDGRAVVTIGGPTVPYVPILRATHPSRFVERTDAVMETRAARGLEDGWNTIAERHGLT
jgi:hypothetical protein